MKIAFFSFDKCLEISFSFKNPRYCECLEWQRARKNEGKNQNLCRWNTKEVWGVFQTIKEDVIRSSNCIDIGWRISFSTFYLICFFLDNVIDTFRSKMLDFYNNFKIYVGKSSLIMSINQI